MTKNTPKNHQEIYETLVNAGLSGNEARAFLVLLELGKGTVTQITRNAGLNRTTGYDVLDNLVAKGLVSISGKEPKQEYIAEPPEKLSVFIETQIKEQENNLKNIKKILPEMRSMHNVAGRPKVRFYEGVQGLKDVYEDTLTSSETILAYANVEEMHNALPGYFPEYYARRAGKNIHIKAIGPKSYHNIERAKRDQAEKRTTLLVPPERFSFHPEINIYDHKIMIASWREKLGIIIESAEISDAMKKIYELAWAEAKRLNETSI